MDRAAKHYFWVGEHVVPIFAGSNDAGEIMELLENEAVVVDWYSGEKKGRTIENENSLRLDPQSPSNRNPYRIGDLVITFRGEQLTVTGIRSEVMVDAKKTPDQRSTYNIPSTELKPSGVTENHMKVRAAREVRAAVSAKPLAVCPRCHALNERCTLEMLSEMGRVNPPVARLCESCGLLSPFSDWLGYNKLS